MCCEGRSVSKLSSAERIKLNVKVNAKRMWSFFGELSAYGYFISFPIECRAYSSQWLYPLQQQALHLLRRKVNDVGARAGVSERAAWPTNQICAFDHNHQLTLTLASIKLYLYGQSIESARFKNLLKEQEGVLPMLSQPVRMASTYVRMLSPT